MNEDLNFIVDKIGMLTTNAQISITTVDENSAPRYLPFTDVVDCWCYSERSPRCPVEIHLRLQEFLGNEAKYWNDVKCINAIGK